MSDPDLRGLAGELHRRGLAAPARLLLDIHRPFRPLIGDVATVIGPALRPLLGGRLAALDEVLGDDATYERLLTELENDEIDETA
jgi:hypothetical protein